MKLFDFADFYYIIEHNNEYFEFEIEDEFLNNISEELDIENFDVLKISEISEGNFDITIKTPIGEEKNYKYVLSPERVSYILSVTE